VAEEVVELPATATLADAVAALRSAHPDREPRLGDVLAVCAYVVDGSPVGRRDPAAVPLAAGAVVEVLPPFAGG
jgi:molybdopterin converting factor small subunit